MPYVNGGIFERHSLEQEHQIDIADDVFEGLFDFFGRWRWHLDERPSGDPTDINPDILGYIFEQYVNQRAQGAYYTKPDVTEFMTTAVVIPAVVNRLGAAGLDDPSVLLARSGDDYLYDSLGFGRDIDLPDDTPPSEYPEAERNLALPGERWCEVLHRRRRYDEVRAAVARGEIADIDTAVTWNLNLRALMDDYLRTLGAVAEVQTALEVLRSLTVCDPTVGSGAFLFAALDVLDDMYTALLERAEELEAKGRGSAPFLAEARAHPNPRYWLLKTICLHNLYGVDIEAEAGEIAKLRLFLKLAAQLGADASMEPLPDLDFNIKTGNLLVGIADTDDAVARFGANRLPTHGLNDVLEGAEQAAAAYEEFTAAQTDGVGRARGGSVDPVAKKLLLRRFEQTRGVADRALFGLRAEAGDFQAWRESHQPFHWFAEFPNVWRRGGFDVIVGNPPYIKASDVRRKYRWQGFATDECPDIYAVCTERAAGLLNDAGRMAFIVKHSASFAKAFAPLRSVLEERNGAQWISSYAKRPDYLFAGSAQVRNSIICIARDSDRGLRVSRCRRWPSESRPHLFETQQYLGPQASLLRGGPWPQWPLIDDPDLQAVLDSLLATQARLSDSLCSQSGASLKFKKDARYALGIYIDEPPAYDAAGRLIPLPETGALQFADQTVRDVAFAALASAWGYLWWAVYGDEFHVTRGVLCSFPVNAAALATGRAGPDLLGLAERLRDELPRHLKWQTNAGVRVGRYDLRDCTHITDKIDRLLADAWELTTEQLEAAWNLRDRLNFGQRD